MGLALAAVDARAARLLALASEATETDVARAIERGGRAMTRTEVIQPALLAIGLGVARAIEARGIDRTIVAGHSLGELGATCIALDLADEDAIALAAIRGRAMADAASARPGGMLAVRGTDERVLADALAAGLVLAAHNAPDERVVSGDLASIARAERAIASSRRLRVAGPWHSPAMLPAIEPFRAAIGGRIHARPLRSTLVSAVSARAIGAAEITDALTDGLVRPVRWVETLRAIEALGATDVVVVAPSRVQRALVRQTLGGRVAIHGIDTPACIDALCL